VYDKALLEICVALIQPALAISDDAELQILAIESIGLLGLLDGDLFKNYCQVFRAILDDALATMQAQGRLSKSTLHEVIVALKSSFDGLIVHGATEQTEALQELIVRSFIYAPEKHLRQLTIEGVAKLLFSINISKAAEAQAVQPSQGQDAEDEKKLAEPSGDEVLIVLISHLIIQWFDKKYLATQSSQLYGAKSSRTSIVKQALDVFFRNYILFSQHRCQIVLQALLRIVFAVIQAKFIDDGRGKKKGN